MTEDDRRKRYFDILGLPDDQPSTAHQAALARAHELRRFEIENYWKRATYFWGFQLVAFGALALTAYRGTVYPPLVLFVSVLGAITGYAAFLTARGSKFWQQNWEAHVDALEVRHEGKLQGFVIVCDQIERSVSKINERLLIILVAGWIFTFLAAGSVIIWPCLTNLSQQRAAMMQIAIAGLAMAGGLLWLHLTPRSGIKARAYRSDDLSLFDKK